MMRKVRGNSSQKASNKIPPTFSTITYPVAYIFQLTSLQSLSCVSLGLQHPRLPCPLPTPEAYLNSCPSSWWCHTTISPSTVPVSSSLQSLPASDLFQWASSLHQVAKIWSFSFSISPSKKCSELISFRMDWLDLLAVQGTLRSLLQHHHSKASILQCSAFFIVQLSHSYLATGGKKQK